MAIAPPAPAEVGAGSSPQTALAEAGAVNHHGAIIIPSFVFSPFHVRGRFSPQALALPRIT